MAYPLAEQKAIEKQKGVGAHSQIDNLIAVNDLQQVSDSSWLEEFLFGPKDIDMGYAPDIALSPFFSKKSILNSLKSLFGKSSKSKFPIAYGKPPKVSGKVSEGPEPLSKELLEELGFTKGGTMTDEARQLFGMKPSLPTIVPRKVWKKEVWE